MTTSQFLSRPNTVRKRQGYASYTTLVWQWLDHASLEHDATGDVMFQLRQRKDLPRSFPTKGHMRRYLLKFLTAAVIDPVFERLWSMYATWLQTARHNNETAS